MKAVTRAFEDASPSGATSLFEHGGIGLRGYGCALRAPLEDAADALADFDISDEVGLPGTGPVAFGALPYDRDAPASVVLPTAVIGTNADGTRWITSIDGAEPVPSPEPAEQPTGMQVRSAMPPDEWCGTIEAGRERIRAGELRKVVLARELIVSADQDFDLASIATRLAVTFPAAYIFQVDGFVGASPELLVDRIGDLVHAQPMAGTAPRSPDPGVDAQLAARLLASTKDREEHQITIDWVHEQLLTWCSYVDWTPEPEIATVANVHHLASTIQARLSDPVPSVLELVEALHPTPAVGGDPQGAAIRLQQELEPAGRGRYAGPVGWVDRHGNGRWAVGIRGAEIEANRARLFAGVGVVADSDPAAELEETRAKFQAMLPALIRP